MQRLRTNCAAEDVMALEAHIAENELQKAEVIDDVLLTTVLLAVLAHARHAPEEPMHCKQGMVWHM